MDKFDYFKGCKCLYTPKGAAREYAAVGCNFYRGCPYQCLYCYNRKGITSGVMGVDHAVLKSCFVNRPKAYRQNSAEEYALRLFRNEVFAHQDYLKDTGIFFSFSTDPVCEATWELTFRALKIAAMSGVPVKVLTKSDIFAIRGSEEARKRMSCGLPAECVNAIPKSLRFLVAFGFTLTGRDDQEPNACTNDSRISCMHRLHDMGYKTFASIEPIVDFPSSYKVIQQTAGFCDQYLIGLMSSRGNSYPPYDRNECIQFIIDVYGLIQKECPDSKIYWKRSVFDYVGNCTFDAIFATHVHRSDLVVSRSYCLQYGTTIYPVHQLAMDLFNVTFHLKALSEELYDKDRKAHEMALMTFFFTYENIRDFMDYLDYLIKDDMEALRVLLERINKQAIRFIKTYESQMDSDQQLKPFITRIGKEAFHTYLLYGIAHYFGLISKEYLKDIKKLQEY